MGIGLIAFSFLRTFFARNGIGFNCFNGLNAYAQGFFACQALYLLVSLILGNHEQVQRVDRMYCVLGVM
jgi:hypothetical protein